jgi:hypothetical protein
VIVIKVGLDVETCGVGIEATSDSMRSNDVVRWLETAKETNLYALPAKCIGRSDATTSLPSII